jgi:hypothetical protein
VIVALALAGCSGGGTPLPSAPREIDTTPVPSLTAAPSPIEPAPTLVHSPEPLEPTALDPLLALRVDIRPDVSAGRVPTLSVYRDGTVLQLSDFGGEILRLTPDGLARLLSVAAESGLLEASGDIDPDPGYAAGFVTYSITFDRAGTIVRRSVVNAFPESRRAEAERFIALADRLATPEAWLPVEAWLAGPTDAVPWVPDRYLLKVVDWGYVPDAVPPIDMSTIVWPLDAGLLEIGDPAVSELGAAAARCVVLTLTEARRVEAALVTAMGDQRIPEQYLAADLAWADRGSFVTVGLHALLPDEPSDCAVDKSWP